MADNTNTNNETLLTFPCDFTIKIFGLSSDEFEAAVFTILRKHVPSFSDRALQLRPSANGKYSAISVTLPVTSKVQLDDIYRDLTASPLVLMAL